jgi:pimeloyl-ACP methyl ester carboxylesterase
MELAILLPGLDGTGVLSERFVAVAPSEWSVRALPLPADRPRGYLELADYLLPLLPSGRFALIAQSFSGPLAILLANRRPNVCAVVLCATFVQPPLPRLLAAVPRLLKWARPPSLALRAFMSGGDARLANAVLGGIHEIPGDVLAARIAAALSVDVRQELEKLAQPLLCLRATRDRLISERSTRIIRALKPSAELASVDGPHLILQASPAESWRQIEPFLARHMRETRLPTIEEVESIELDVASHAFESERVLRIRALDPSSYPKYRPFSLVFTGVSSFAGSEDLSGVHFCCRGPSPKGDGLIFELEVREIVPTEGRAVRVEVSGRGDARISFGRTAGDVRARVVAAAVTVEETAG